MMSATAAIILAGGRGSRLGGRDKAALRLDGRSLLERVVAAADLAGAHPIVIVGPDRPGFDGCVQIRESPAYGGPLLALAAGLEAPGVSSCEWVFILSCDLVRPNEVVTALAAAGSAPDIDALLLQDPHGRAQWLASRARRAALRSGINDARAAGSLAHRPIREAFRTLRCHGLPAEAGLVADIDTPHDLAAATTHSLPPVLHPDREDRAMTSETHLPPEALETWLHAAATAVDVDPRTVSIATVLDLARDVAHGVARPAAPLTTFLLGVAVGRAGAGHPTETDTDTENEELRRLAAILTRRAAAWEPPDAAHP